MVMRPHHGAVEIDPTPLLGHRCLVVDDLPLNREIMVRQLVGLGANADTAEDGIAALAMLRQAAADGAPYHLVLVDRVMPVMDGIALARAVRRDPSFGAPALASSGEHLRLVLCASGQVGEPRDGLDLFDAQLIKPVLASRLRSVIAMLAAAPGHAADAPADTTPANTPQSPAPPALPSASPPRPERRAGAGGRGQRHQPDHHPHHAPARRRQGRYGGKRRTGGLDGAALRL